MKSLYSCIARSGPICMSVYSTIQTLRRSIPGAISRGEPGAAESIDGRMTRA